jgi:hypothetical protein
MNVLKKGRSQKGWAKEFSCTGNGNNGGGCGALLLVEEPDLFHTCKCYVDGGTDYFTTFQCCECGVLTDLPESETPPNAGRHLPHFNEWKKKLNEL